MIKAILFYFLFLFSTFSFCQNSYRDDLNDKLENVDNKKAYLKKQVNSINDAVKLAVVFNQLGLQYQYSSEFDSAIICHHLALNHALDADKINQEIGVSYNKIGIVHYYEGRADSAYFYIKKGIPFFEEPIAKANALNNLALMCKFRQEPNEAIENYLESLKIYQNHNDTSHQVDLLNNIGALHKNLKEDSIAEDYHNRALGLAKAMNEDNLIFDSKSNLATIYFNRAEYEKAIVIHKEAITFYRDNNDYKFVIVNLNNLANIYSAQGSDNKALKLYLDALDLMGKKSLFVSKEAVLLNVGSIYQTKKNFNKALDYYNQSLILAKENELVYRYVPIYEGLSSVYRDLNNIDSSLHYKNLHIALKDSLDAVEKEKKMLELESEHKNGELSSNLAKTTQVLNETEKSKSLISKGLLFSIIGLIIVSVGVFIFYRRNKKSEALSDSLKIANEKKDDNINSLSNSLEEKDQALVSMVKQKGNVKLEFPKNLEVLTEREKEVLIGVKDGLKDQEIADRLFISITTVRTHLRKAYVKIDARNRAEAIQFISTYKI